MLDLSGFEISADEKDILDHPLVGGVILFSRNYHDKKQLSELVAQIRHHARNSVLVAVDHEGGRVQRFREGFSAIPAMGSLITQCQQDMQQAKDYAYQFGWLMAAEVLNHDIDISFAPVLDIQGISEVIGDRSFSSDPEQIIELAAQFIKGMRLAGMKSTGKHFPGHGNVKEDSHIAMPVDRRGAGEISQQDMHVFKAINQLGLLDAVMPAHVIYPDVDDLPAGFSEIWLQQHLRQNMAFDGVIFSDDLSMHGAVHIGNFCERAKLALSAGCDMVLVCNDPRGAAQVLDSLPIDTINSHRLPRLAKQPTLCSQALLNSPEYLRAKRDLDRFYAL